MNELFIQLITAGLLFPVLFIFAYIYLKFPQRIYLSVLFLVIASFLYVVFDLFSSVYGGMSGNISIALEFNRLQELSSSLFIPLFPFFLNSILSLNRPLRMVNRGLLYFGIAFFTLILGVAFFAPEYFISLQNLHPNPSELASLAGRGSRGLVFQIRDLVLLAIIIYSILLTIIELTVHREFNYLMQLLFGYLLAVLLGISALVKNFTGSYIDLFGNLPYSRVGLAITVFVLFGLSAYIRFFLNQAKMVQEAKADLEEKEKELKHLAYYDDLTGLLNRKSFFMRAGQQLNTALEKGEERGFLLIDIDNFSSIVDAYGEEISDYLLLLVAERISEKFGSEESIFRTGGDEFALITTDNTSVESLEKTALELMEIFEIPFNVGLDNLFLSVSMGMALFPENGESPEELFKNAMRALAKAKVDKNKYAFFNPELSLNAARRLKLVHGLRESISGEEFAMFYQPMLNSKGEISDAEALIRWTHPDFQHVSPAEFIPLAEISGLILPLSDWVLQRVAQDAEELEQESLGITLHINLSAKQLKEKNLCDKIIQTLAAFDLDSKKISFEVTESSLVENFQTVQKELHCLREEGYSISIDDFGTGYSSLSYLRELPFDKIKIDKSFIQKVHKDGAKRSLVASMITLGQQLNYKIVAEGVEEPQEFEFLRQHSCDYYQGYLISHPLPFKVFCEFLVEGTNTATLLKP